MYTHYLTRSRDWRRSRSKPTRRPRGQAAPRTRPPPLVDDNPAKVAKINEDSTGAPATGLVSGAWLFQFAAPQPIAFAALIHTTAADNDCRRGACGSRATHGGLLRARLLGGVCDPAVARDGRGRWPQNPYIVLDGEAGYRSGGLSLLAARLRESAREHPGRRSTLPPTYYAFDPDLRWGLSVSAPRSRRSRTARPSACPRCMRAARPSGKQDADILLTDDMRAALEDHWYDVKGRTRPWVIVPSGPVRDDRCYLVRYAMSEEAVRWDNPEVITQRLHSRKSAAGCGRESQRAAAGHHRQRQHGRSQRHDGSYGYHRRDVAGGGGELLSNDSDIQR